MGILDFVFPKTCLECKKEGKYICSSCVLKVRILKPVCPYCEKASIDGFTHSKCAKKYGLDGLTSIWDYEGVIRKAILSLKYKYSTEVGKELTNVYIQKTLTGFLPVKESILAPIPLHWYKENMRGFNQSEEIGKLISREMGWGFNPDLLVKKKSTVSQTKLTVEERKKNLSDVFAIDPRYSSTDLPNYSSIVIFDDVFTTGSTLKEAAKVLKHAGVKKVWGMTIAR